MTKIEPLKNRPSLPAPELRGFDPEPGVRRVRFAAFVSGPVGTVDVFIWRSLMRGIWTIAACLTVTGGGVPFHVDVDVTDEREEFVVTADNAPEDLQIYATELQPPGEGIDGGGLRDHYRAEIDEARAELPPGMKYLSLSEAIRALVEEAKSARASVGEILRPRSELPPPPGKRFRRPDASGEPLPRPREAGIGAEDAPATASETAPDAAGRPTET